MKLIKEESGQLKKISEERRQTKYGGITITELERICKEIEVQKEITLVQETRAKNQLALEVTHHFINQH